MQRRVSFLSWDAAACNRDLQHAPNSHLQQPNDGEQHLCGRPENSSFWFGSVEREGAPWTGEDRIGECCRFRPEDTWKARGCFQSARQWREDVAMLGRGAVGWTVRPSRGRVRPRLESREARTTCAAGHPSMEVSDA